MPIFLDSCDVAEIKKFMEMGVIRGVTTNPTILCKANVKGGIAKIKSLTVEIAGIIEPYPLSVEGMQGDPSKMLDEALEISSWAENINVKIPVHGPKGEMEYLKIVHQLETEKDVRVNVTACMSAQQILLAALSGGTFVSLFGGRVNNMGYNTIEEIKKARKVLDDNNLKSKIIIGSTREVLNIIEWLTAGAHIVTAVPDLLKGMLVHPYTKETVKMFLEDASKL